MKANAVAVILLTSLSIPTQSMTVDFCGFEKPLAQIYNAGSVVEGWTVVSNAVSVARDTNFAHTGSQLLALSTGRITRNIPTLAGHQYRLTIAYRDPGTVGWWRGENNTADLINGNTGTIVSTVGYGGGKVGQAFNFTGGSNQKIALPEIPDYQMTNSLTIESWINLRSLANGIQVIFFRGNWEDDRDPYKIMVETNRVRDVALLRPGSMHPPEAHRTCLDTQLSCFKGAQDYRRTSKKETIFNRASTIASG